MGPDMPSATAPSPALIGCGAIADGFHLPALARHRDILAKLVLVDPAIERARALASKHGVAATAARLDDVLDRIEGAIVAVPPRHHQAVALPCIARGVHVLCEKPLCGTAEHAPRPRDAAD